MTAHVSGFLKVETTKGRTLYVNAHHIGAIDASTGTVLHLHSGEKVAITESAEDVLATLEAVQPIGAGPLQQRRRERRRRAGQR